MARTETRDGENSLALMDIAAAAKPLAVPEGWLRGAVTARKVPCTRFGKHVRFSQAHIAAIIAAGEKPAVLPTPSWGSARCKLWELTCRGASLISTERTR